MSNNFHQTQVQWQVAVRFVLNVILYMGGKRNYDFFSVVGSITNVIVLCWLVKNKVQSCRLRFYLMINLGEAF